VFTNAISDQLSGSFEELMEEIRAMRRELERMRVALEAQNAMPRPVHGNSVPRRRLVAAPKSA
jgi:hypothetical protein